MTAPQIPASSAGFLPEEYRCPLTGEAMVDPVKTSDGFRFERSNIEGFIRKTGLCPITGEARKVELLVPDSDFRYELQAWFQSHSKASSLEPLVGRVKDWTKISADRLKQAETRAKLSHFPLSIAQAELSQRLLSSIPEELQPSEEKELVISEAKEILDVEDVIASIMLVEDLRIQRD